MVQLMVTPEISLADSPVWIRAVGLTPSQPVTLHSSLIDEKNVKFEARAFYWANEAGEIDVKKASAVGGDYTGVCPMGLFWSLKPEKMFHRLIKRDVIGSPFHVQINLFGSFVMMPSEKDTPLATCTIERWFVTPGVEQIKIKDGQVRGSLFMPPGPGPFPGVIDMFGGGGGLIKFRASLLASKGFAVLALAYMAYEDLPQTLAEVNLEYFEEAAKLLLKHPKAFQATISPGNGRSLQAAPTAAASTVTVAGGKVVAGIPRLFPHCSELGKEVPRGPGRLEAQDLGVIGVSKGSEIALAMASFLVQIVAAVCINGTTTVNDRPLRFRDIYIPGVCYYPEKFLINSMGALGPAMKSLEILDEAHQAACHPFGKGPTGP
uniref:Uncharacterized protein n=1 Tax=Sphaerodactylus townsendi TaxID=933632 RepID=A0ACB8G284_9SAUR